MPEDYMLRSMAYKMLGDIQSFAPDGNTQNEVAVAFNEAVGAGNSALEMVQWTVNVLADGLNHGNWPWSSKASGSFRAIRGTELQAGMVLALPFGKTAEIKRILSRGRTYIAIQTELGNRRLRMDDEVLILI